MRRPAVILQTMNRRKTLRRIAVLFLLLVFLFSGWQVLSILSEYKTGEASYEDLSQAYTTRQPVTPADKPQDPVPESEPAEETEPKETAPITVDFDALLAECPDVVGWLYCPDTPINYPVVQAEDNDYYLRRLLDGTWNSNGSIFMDYRCPSDFSGGNSILYGHNMKNDAMFGTLEDYRKQEYYDAHPVLYLLTPAQDYRIDLIGGYTTPGTAEDTYSLPDTQDGRDTLVNKARRNPPFLRKRLSTTENALSPFPPALTITIWPGMCWWVFCGN